MNFTKILKSLFGDKSSRDMKLIQPLVDKAKSFTPQIQAMSNDERISRTTDLKGRNVPPKAARGAYYPVNGK